MTELIVDHPGRISGRFTSGRRASMRTEFKAGERRSPATEFRRGKPAHNKLPIGAVRVRIEANTHLPRAWVKLSEPNVWQKRAIVVWEAVHGPLPRGCVVHHKDRDSMNDDISNLVALTLSAHRAEHHEEMLRARIGN